MTKHTTPLGKITRNMLCDEYVYPQDIAPIEPTTPVNEPTNELDEQLDELLFGLSKGFKEWFKPAVKTLITTAREEAYKKGYIDGGADNIRDWMLHHPSANKECK